MNKIVSSVDEDSLLDAANSGVPVDEAGIGEDEMLPDAVPFIVPGVAEK
ncbi:hypothetical protein ACFQAT_28710 [Undibacterium arcticum]|uniref:Uncharacterized protein n=1 Tax=Undibacterium arcticum TaxID=1762892 RepID=A0ABV7F759_9BURK